MKEEKFHAHLIEKVLREDRGKKKEEEVCLRDIVHLFIDINNEIPREGESCPGNQRRQEKGLIFRD